MSGTKIYFRRVKLSNPVALIGLPGIGNVGALVGKYLKESLEAKRFATLYSSHFPHQAVMLKSGNLRLVSNRFYCYKAKKGGTDLILLLGDVQAASPEGQYEVNDKIVRFLKFMGTKRIYTIGGYNVGNRYIEHPRVFSVATDKKLMKELQDLGVLFGKASGMIWGSAGLVVAFAKRHKVPAACIMGETGLLDMDANSAKAVLEVLSKALGVEVNMEDIEKIKKQTEKMLKELEEATKTTMGQPESKEGMTYIR